MSFVGMKVEHLELRIGSKMRLNVTTWGRFLRIRFTLITNERLWSCRSYLAPLAWKSFTAFFCSFVTILAYIRFVHGVGAALAARKCCRFWFHRRWVPPAAFTLIGSKMKTQNEDHEDGKRSHEVNWIYSGWNDIWYLQTAIESIKTFYSIVTQNKSNHFYKTSIKFNSYMRE